MAHMIDMTNNAAGNIAFVGEKPWHRLGTELLPGMTLDAWAAAAGLTHEVRKAAVEFHDGSTGHVWADKHVLYRTDNSAPLGLCSSGYHIVQPREVLDFFAKLAERKGFTIETAGCLDKGRRVWALAKAGDGAAVGDSDEVRPYVLLATSYDGTMATTGKLTSVRVVCHNTLTMSVGYRNEGQSEADSEGSTIRIPHSEKFDADSVRLDLGLTLDAFEHFMADARRLAKRAVTQGFATEYLKEVLPPVFKLVELKDGSKVKQPTPIEDSKAFKQVMALFNGEGKGADLKEAKGTAWGLLNAVTEHTDWQRARSDSGRMSSAWFGAGEAMKNTARERLLEMVK